MPTTDHGAIRYRLANLRDNMTPNDVDGFALRLSVDLAVSMLEAHDETGISLEQFPEALALVSHWMRIIGIDPADHFTPNGI